MFKLNTDYLLLASLAISALVFSLTLFLLYVQSQFKRQNQMQGRQLDQLSGMLQEKAQNNQILNDNLLRQLQEFRQEQHSYQIKNLQLIQDNLHQGMNQIRHQITETLNQNAANFGKQVDKLTQNTDQRLKEISQQVEKRLSDGFEKTTATFTAVMERLAAIDNAQKKITELSSNVVSLQEVLADKRSRGAFGEVQLNALIQNVIPESHFKFQYTLSNKNRADCILFLPEPTGNVVIDAKFPLESYRRMSDMHLAESERHLAEQQFRKDVLKHIKDIASKYLIPGETADGAVMFIPAEAIFAEIHARYPDLVEIAHNARVWLTSPTTLMAILTTARAVIKDAATRKQVHIIQEHLIKLGEDFARFQKRMDALATHIQQANEDVKQVHTSSQKISSRFNKIERVELQEKEFELLETSE
jgi:DNA recombination protein RmuC